MPYSIYETDKVRLPSVQVTKWQRDKLHHYCEVYGLSYADLIKEVIYELRLAFSTIAENASFHRDVHETVGRVVDRLTSKNEILGRVEAKGGAPRGAWWRG